MQRMNGAFDIILYATLAVIVCVVFYSVLGRQVGRGPDEDASPEDIFGTTRDFTPEAKSDGGMVVPLHAGDDTPTGVAAVMARDADFSPKVFLDQATTAYSMVLEAFAAGDRDTLEMLLTPRMSGLYNEAIAEREMKLLTQVTDVLRIASVDIVDARVEENLGEVDVAFGSELSSALVDADGKPVAGDPDMVASVREVWTFSRDLAGSDPAWFLADVAPEETDGQELAVDPAPDTKPDTNPDTAPDTK